MKIELTDIEAGREVIEFDFVKEYYVTGCNFAVVYYNEEDPNHFKQHNANGAERIYAQVTSFLDVKKTIPPKKTDVGMSNSTPEVTSYSIRPTV